MCGRIALIQPQEDKMKKRFHLTKTPQGLKPRFNIAPSQDIAVILNESPQELSLVRWGLIPHWAKAEKTKYSMINAKAETVTEKPAYRGPIKNKRCLVIADTFYEWKKINGTKQPYRIMMKDGGLFALAGIWDTWKNDGKELKTCSIITTDANQLMKSLHDRMPVILPPEMEEKWLSDLGMDEVKAMLVPYNTTPMEAYEISTLVNSPTNDTPELIRPIAEYA
jgi:putative SOS response-associated peptidase YedK